MEPRRRRRSRFYICLGFGSNVGNLEINLLNAISSVKKEIAGISASGASDIYLSSPVGAGATEQPYFLNCAVLFGLNPAKRIFSGTGESFPRLGKYILGILKEIEKSMGRKSGTERNMPRIIDIDMLFILDNASNIYIKLDLPDIKLPHAEIFNRKFVLYPLLDLRRNAFNFKKPFDEEGIKKALAKIEKKEKPDSENLQKISLYGKFDENLIQILR